MLGVIFVEGDGFKASKAFGAPAVYYDAVGDLDRLNDEYGPSVSYEQIRTLRDPMSGNAADRWRVASKLRDPVYAAQAAWVISKQGTDFTPWSAYKSREYLKHMTTGDYALIPGHPDAQKWNM